LWRSSRGLDRSRDPRDDSLRGAERSRDPRDEDEDDSLRRSSRGLDRSRDPRDDSLGRSRSFGLSLDGQIGHRGNMRSYFMLHSLHKVLLSSSSSPPLSSAGSAVSDSAWVADVMSSSSGRTWRWRLRRWVDIGEEKKGAFGGKRKARCVGKSPETTLGFFPLVQRDERTGGRDYLDRFNAQMALLAAPPPTQVPVLQCEVCQMTQLQDVRLAFCIMCAASFPGALGPSTHPPIASLPRLFQTLSLDDRQRYGAILAVGCGLGTDVARVVVEYLHFAIGLGQLVDCFDCSRVKPWHEKNKHTEMVRGSSGGDS
jgi:hypothetical protein